jgi:hypothetical protein
MPIWFGTDLVEIMAHWVFGGNGDIPKTIMRRDHGFNHQGMVVEIIL